MNQAAPAYKDAPYAPVSIWSGFYAGLNGGYGAQNDTGSISSNAGVTSGFAPEGGFGGGQIGYNLQGKILDSHLLLGVEADVQGAAIRDAYSQGPSANSGLSSSDVFRSKSSLDWFGTVRGRLGITFDRALVYATGGFAYGSLNQQITAINGAHQVFEDAWKSGVRTGYAVGGGAEYMIAPSWSVKAEYQFIDLGSSPLNGTNPLTHTPVVTSDAGAEFQTLRGGLNYRVGSNSEPLK